MDNVTEKLWELQTVMLQLEEQESRLRNKPADFAAIDDEFQALERARGEMRERQESLGGQRRELERELEVEQEALKKYQGQLMQVKNQQQYSAAWKEIDTARRKAKEVEDALLAKMGEIDTIEQELTSGEGAWSELKSKHEAAYEKWQGSLGDIRAAIEETKKRIEAVEAGIPARALQDFRRLYSQRPPAMARVEGGACGACRVQLRPALTQQLKRGERVYCDSCRRILYLEPVEA